MSEFQRLLRELRAATTPREAHTAIRLGMHGGLSANERRQLLAAFPRRFSTDGLEEAHMLATIENLQAMNVEAGLATKWGQTTPWRTNPWQLIQVSASRAMFAAIPAMSASHRGPMERFAKILAVSPTPLEAWTATARVAAGEPIDVKPSLQFASRALFAAWTAMQRQEHEPAAKTLESFARNVLKAIGEPVGPVEFAGLAAQVASMAALTPEQLAMRMRQVTPKLWQAMPELLAVAAVHAHVRQPQDAEAWLNLMLTT